MCFGHLDSDFYNIIYLDRLVVPTMSTAVESGRLYTHYLVITLHRGQKEQLMGLKHFAKQIGRCDK